MEDSVNKQIVQVAGVQITTDEAGRYNLNALHRASGEGEEKAPGKWLRNKQTQELVQELIDGQICPSPISASKGGFDQGTFAHELLVVSYAGWISPAFQIRVNQVFLDYKSGLLRESIPQIPTTAEAFISAFTMISESQKKQVEHDRAIARLSEDVGHLKETQTVLTGCPANAEPITKIRPRMNARYGLSAKVVDAVMRQSPYAPKPAGHVRNSHEDAVNSTYAVYWKKDITMTFDRFVLECKKVTATQYTHPFIEGRFRIEDKRDGHSATVLPIISGAIMSGAHDGGARNTHPSNPPQNPYL